MSNHKEEGTICVPLSWSCAEQNKGRSRNKKRNKQYHLRLKKECQVTIAGVRDIKHHFRAVAVRKEDGDRLNAQGKDFTGGEKRTFQEGCREC